MSNTEILDRFMAVSWLYLLMTEKTSSQLTSDEIEELFVTINDEHGATVEVDSRLN